MRYFIIILFVLVGCKAKTKIVEKMSAEVERVTTIEQVETVSVDSTGTSSTIVVDNVDQSDITLTQADPNKEIVLIDSDGKKTIIKGANAVLSQSNSNTIKSDDTNTSVSKNEDTSISVTNKENIDVNNRRTNSDITTTSTWLWVLLLILFIVCAYLVYRRYKSFIL